MKVHIEDDFDLDKIAFCGQCFRARKFDDGMFRFITGEEVLYMKQESEGLFTISCGEEDWRHIWRPYFDLSRSYKDLRSKTDGGNPFVVKAVECGSGLRILRQDTWEMLITFIISQRKSIPAIARAVEELCKRFGREMTTEYETLYGFPSPGALAAASGEELAACGLGYRTAYVRDAAQRVASGQMDLEALEGYSDEELFDALLTVRGIGKKVADCVCLFGYGRTARAPVDVWILRAINSEFGGVNPFPQYGEDAGIIQQYIFYYQKNR